MTVAIRKFLKEDIPYKVKWINDNNNNEYLHYDLPLREDKTLEWFKTLKNRLDRVDLTITYNDEPAGIIGLLNIDSNTKDAEYYICLGGEEFKGKGIAQRATDLLITKASKEYGLENIYLYTEVGNMAAQKLFEKVGFKKIRLIKNDLFHHGNYIDRYYYRIEI